MIGQKNMGILLGFMLSACLIASSVTAAVMAGMNNRTQFQLLGSMWQLLMAMNECGLKNDALMDTFYDVVMEQYHTYSDYAILVFHDRYDIPAKASDNERLWESEEVFEYMICAVCPMTGEYEPGKPECGFLFPAFTDRSGDLNHIAVFQADTGHPHDEILEVLGLSAGV